jgi:hypothetical protein
LITVFTNQLVTRKTRVATVVHAMKVFAHPDGKEKTAADINEALLSTLTVARNELKHVANLKTEFNELPPDLPETIKEEIAPRAVAASGSL